MKQIDEWSLENDEIGTTWIGLTQQVNVTRVKTINTHTHTHTHTQVQQRDDDEDDEEKEDEKNSSISKITLKP